jgi:hypothetical protein
MRGGLVDDPSVALTAPEEGDVEIVPGPAELEAMFIRSLKQNRWSWAGAVSSRSCLLSSLGPHPSPCPFHLFDSLVNQSYTVAGSGSEGKSACHPVLDRMQRCTCFGHTTVASGI